MISWFYCCFRKKVRHVALLLNFNHPKFQSSHINDLLGYIWKKGFKYYRFFIQENLFKYAVVSVFTFLVRSPQVKICV